MIFSTSDEKNIIIIIFHTYMKTMYVYACSVGEAYWYNSQSFYIIHSDVLHVFLV